MKTPDIGDSPIEDDPTGMRALLSSLPDPGPMPPDLSARILAALEREAGYAESGSIWDDEPAPPVPGVPPAPMRSLATHAEVGGRVPTRRRRRAPIFAVAAALAIFALGGGALVRLVTDGLSGQSTAGSAYERPATDEAASRDSGVAAGSTDAASPPLSRNLGDFRVTTSGTAYSIAGLAGEARTALTARGVESTSEQARLSLATPAGVSDCARALAGTPVHVDFGSYQGTEAALVVDTTSTGATRAYVVQLTCSAAAPGILAGPVDVD